MQLPAKTSSSEVCLNFTAHIAGACEAWRDASIITPQQQAVVGEVGDLVSAAADVLRSRDSAVEEAERATSKARARFGVRDLMLDLSVMRVSDGVLNGPALRNREHPVYLKVFLGTTPSDITRSPMREEPELASRLRQRLTDAPEFPTKAALIADLDTALANSLTARDALLAAEDAENRAVDADLTARLALRHTVEEAYGRLRAAFPGRRDFVESFFPKRDVKASAKPAPDKPPSDNPAPEQPATAPAHEPAPTG